LNLTHRISESDRFVRKGEFHGFQFDLFLGDEIKDNTIGIVGLGCIGKDVAKILKNGFGCKVYYFDCIRDEKFEKEIGIEFVASLEELMKMSDILSIHVPLCDATRFLIHESNLKLMKSNSYVINTSRGAVIKEIDLVNALKNKIIKGAALDVFENEPLITEDLFSMENVILTPHIAASSDEAHKAMIEMAIENVKNFVEGNTPKNLIK
jgi:glyoxylate reductase